MPVIVVGLQSVHGHTHRPQSPPPLSPLANPARSASPLPRPSSRRASNIWPTSAPGGSEDGWRARAADAFRGLRRRGGDASTSAATTGEESAEASAGVGASASEGEAAHAANGSTTFFIYVIGGTLSPPSLLLPLTDNSFIYTGYYPPSHPLVTGAPNAALDSFEALWELADLL